jgi:hypothetical protein
MSKYARWNRWLMNAREDNYRLTFRQLENILTQSLPDSARRHPEWWANERGGWRHTQCKSWTDAGFETADVNLSTGEVSFRRIH